MPLQKILFKPGVNRENTRYTTEGGWYESDKVRFRQGTPEVIGGWRRISSATFLGVCRSLWNWVTLIGYNLLGVGTNLKFYIETGGVYNDITPIRTTVTLGANPFALTASTTVTVTATAHGCFSGDFVTFSGAVNIGGVGTNVTAAILNKEFQVTVLTANTYTIVISVTPNATALLATPGGGSAVVAAYQINTGSATQLPSIGWGSNTWGSGFWGLGVPTSVGLRLWNQVNFGENLLFGPNGGSIYYWIEDIPTYARGILLSQPGSTTGAVSITVASPAVVTLAGLALTEGATIQFNYTSGGSLPTGLSINTTYSVFNLNGITFNLLDSAGNVVNTTGSASVNAYISLLVDVPTVQSYFTVSDASRFVIAFGCNDYGSVALDPMLIRWSNQEDPYNWTPDPTNQAGFTRLSHGSKIVTAIQTRQEIVVFTDSSLYSLQYLGPPYVWSSQLLGDNISIISPNSVALASGIVYWMGIDKFYMYDGRVQTLNCDLRKFIFSNINASQYEQTFSGTNEGFNEVWWFYCSKNSSTIDRYVIYNYLEKIWYYGTMARTAWLDTGLREFPQAATYSRNIVAQENGINDNETAVETALNAYISSSEFDIGDGHNFGFVWRVLPDITFNESTNSTAGAAPAVAMTLYGMQNSGSGVTNTASASVQEGTTYVITEEFTGQIYTRVRARQMIFKVSSNQINTAWQLGAPRIDIRPDGRR
tara:strand:- start:625 stop:2748 length:2124 start_codon:yes stop_codon:yes gene_type:complete